MTEELDYDTYSPNNVEEDAANARLDKFTHSKRIDTPGQHMTREEFKEYIRQYYRDRLR